MQRERFTRGVLTMFLWMRSKFQSDQDGVLEHYELIIYVLFSLA
jgi:hypothetical protein